VVHLKQQCIQSNSQGSMQASAPLDEDLEGLTGYGRWRRSQETSRRSFTARLIAEAVGGVCLLALLCWVIALSVQLRSLQNSNVRIAPECLHALGGGPVGSGGSLHPVMPEHCTAQLRAYAQGPYWDEVQLAAAAAMQQFGFADSVAAGSSNGASSIDGSRFISSVFSKLPSAILQRVARSLLVAAGTAPEGPGSSLSSSSSSGGSGRLGGPTHRQIAGHLLGQRASAQLLHTTGTADATAAAAAEGMAAARQQQLQQQQQGSVRPLVVFDIDETLLSNMPQILDPQAWPWEKWVAEAQAKALQPMLRLYTALCRCGSGTACSGICVFTCVVWCCT
jgi:hypothetical protein